MSKNTLLSRAERERILLSCARKQLGKPYQYGAHERAAPRRFDCSSFTQYCFRRIGIELPRLSIAQAEYGRKVSSVRQLRPGDLVFMRGTIGRYNEKFPEGIGHVAIYTGRGNVIHASGDEAHGRVVEEPLKRALAKRKPIVALRRLF